MRFSHRVRPHDHRFGIRPQAPRLWPTDMCRRAVRREHEYLSGTAPRSSTGVVPSSADRRRQHDRRRREGAHRQHRLRASPPGHRRDTFAGVLDAQAGLLLLTRHLATELAARGSRVNTVAPTVVRTSTYQEFIPKSDVDSTLGGLNTLHPPGPTGTPTTWPPPSYFCCPAGPAGSPASSGVSTVGSWQGATDRSLLPGGFAGVLGVGRTGDAPPGRGQFRGSAPKSLLWERRWPRCARDAQPRRPMTRASSTAHGRGRPGRP
ncbi:SDR family oxidoreductase [Streptomyces sp. NPDC004680]|uniref:SDR family oxidoreductase n=1 Tax=Streptomyces sp. NPDC004680 TaxID=3154287 RepID=UPI0033BD2192